MPDFTLFIPSEIFINILSHVTQKDCIEGMTVCHRWYNVIPQHAKVLWRELRISEWSLSRWNNAILACLGTHVKKVNIVSLENSNKILQRLERQQCNIQSLEIKTHFRIYDFQLDRSTLFNGIGLFARTLKELYMNGQCTHYFSLPLLLDCLPALTHLTIKFKKDNRLALDDGEPIYETNDSRIQSIHYNSNNNDNYNLVFLCLESEFRPDFYMKEVVKRCPQLKYLLVSKDNTYESRLGMPIDFLLILKLCPSIRYINWGDDIKAIKNREEWFTLSRRRTGRDTNNESNDNYEEGGEREINLRQIEFYNDNEQQHVSTLTVCLRHPSVLQHLRLYTSSRLNFYQIWNDFRQQDNNLLSRPSQLKSLDLIGFHIPKQTENDRFFKDFFNYFQHVEQLKMHVFVASADNIEAEQYYLPNLAPAIGHQLHQLRYLYLGFDYRDNYDPRFTLVDYNDLLATLGVRNQKLEILHIYNVPILNKTLLDLCHHPQLHTLGLSGCRLHSQVTKDGWISFARKLKEQEQNNSITRIQTMTLSCRYPCNVSDEVLEELAGVKSLKTLRIEYSTSITNAGINKFLSTNGGSSSSEKPKKIELYCCELFGCSKELLANPYVQFVYSPTEEDFYIYDATIYRLQNYMTYY